MGTGTSCITNNGQKGCLDDRRLEGHMGRIPIVGRYHGKIRRLDEDYVMTQQVLGDGINGEVRMATSVTQQKGQKFAVKSVKLSSGLGSDVDGSDPIREVENYLCMDHPNITRLHDVYETKGHLHLVMECMEGGDLAGRLADKGRFTELEASSAVGQMLLALNYLHRQGIAHRDVKLDNFLCVSKDSDHLKLSDFGFSRRCGPKGDGRMTDVVGTLSYTAPEVLKCIHGRKCSYTLQCDMWSVGVSAFLLLAGEMPFSGDDAQQIRKIRAGLFTLKPELRASMSSEGLLFILSLLQVDPSKRLTAQSALEQAWVSQHRVRDGVDVSVLQALEKFARASPFRRHCLQMLGWCLASEDLATLNESFMSLDAEQHGTLTLKGLTPVLMNKLGVSDEAVVQQILQSLDYNHDQQIHYSDFLAAVVGSQIGFKDELLSSAFRRFDVDNTGYITSRSLQAVLGNKVDSATVEAYIAEVAQTKTGRIDFSAFAAYMRSFGSSDDTTYASGTSMTSTDVDLWETPPKQYTYSWVAAKQPAFDALYEEVAI